MCGITGIYNFKTLTQIDRAIIQNMNDVIKYRGPDDDGIYIDNEIGLGHRRLSIIDLSSAGHQPLSNEDDTIWLVFNGEIYNYIELIPELQAKGHVFKSQTDSEVIIHAYEEYGIDCVSKFNGMFAFAIWDQNKKRLLLARDRLGVKPLYYALNSEGIVFASEIKSILQHPWHKHPEADNAAIYDYINDGYLTGNRTLFREVNKINPGCLMVIENSELKEHVYWKLQFAPISSEISEKDYIEKLRELIIDSIKIRLRSDVPVGFHLSGGLDSSAIVSITNKIFNVKPRTFSLRFNESMFDENKFISIVKDDIDTEHKEIMPDIEKHFPEKLREIVYLSDEPIDGPSVLAKYEINKFIKENGITVALTGQGADEILGGYKRFLYQYIKQLQNPKMFKYFLKNINSGSLMTNLIDHGSLFTHDLKNIITKLFKYNSQEFKTSLFNHDILNLVNQNNTNLNYYQNLYPEAELDKYSNLSKCMHYETTNYLQSLLHSEDRTGMGISLETRTPFVDYRLVELTATIPDYFKLKNLSTKHLLREAMKGILPEPIRLRKDKKGFPTPASRWFRTSQKKFLEDIIFSTELNNRGIFNRDYLKMLFNEHQKGMDHTFKLWYILSLEIWFREFID